MEETNIFLAMITMGGRVVLELILSMLAVQVGLELMLKRHVVAAAAAVGLLYGEVTLRDLFRTSEITFSDQMKGWPDLLLHWHLPFVCLNSATKTTKQATVRSFIFLGIVLSNNRYHNNISTTKNKATMSLPDGPKLELIEATEVSLWIFDL